MFIESTLTVYATDWIISPVVWGEEKKVYTVIKDNLEVSEED